MKDTKKILRNAIFNALDGNITYGGNPVIIQEEKLSSNISPSMFILLLNQQESSTEQNDGAFITQSGIDIEITHLQGAEVTKDDIDDVYEQILEILFPSPWTHGLTAPSGFQFLNGFRENSFTNTVQIINTETIITERFKVTFTIVEQ